ncbi:MAG TPA: CoA ester lyase [Candidatus Binatia bacterium]|nr:CoA ester lyase [Candidatus Binatia bacterium]
MTARPAILRRSLLFVPASDERKVERARAASADTVLLDLEDAVAPDTKDGARRTVAEALRARAFGATEVAVRVNAPGSPWFEDDVAAVAATGGRTILLPKAETAEGVAAVAARLRGLPGLAPPEGFRLLLLVETPLGIASALALARAAPEVDALCFGHADFCLEMGLRVADAASGVAFHARCALAIAARAAGVAAIDCVHLAVKDETGFRADAERGRDLGFDGKLCIHPRQAEIANEVYTPARDAIERALRVVQAAERAAAAGRGVFELDGRMVDAPVVALERRVLERARRAGVLGDAP